MRRWKAAKTHGFMPRLLVICTSCLKPTNMMECSTSTISRLNSTYNSHFRMQTQKQDNLAERHFWHGRSTIPNMQTNYSKCLTMQFKEQSLMRKSRYPTNNHNHLRPTHLHFKATKLRVSKWSRLNSLKNLTSRGTTVTRGVEWK